MDGAATFSPRLSVVCLRLVVIERPGLVGQKQICRQLACQDGRDDLTVESCRRFGSLVVPCKSRAVAFFPVSAKVEAQTAICPNACRSDELMPLSFERAIAYGDRGRIVLAATDINPSRRSLISLFSKVQGATLRVDADGSDFRVCRSPEGKGVHPCS